MVINILKKVLALLGCLLFVFSFIYPLYYARFITLAGSGSIYCWSYKVDYRNYIMAVSHSNQYWLSNYWFSPYSFVGLGTPWILISLFTVQVLTLVFGLASVIFNRRILTSAPALLSLAVMALMICTGEILSGYRFYGEYQQGYYLLYPSVILFLSAFGLSEVTRRNKQEKVKIPAPNLIVR